MATSTKSSKAGPKNEGTSSGLNVRDTWAKLFKENQGKKRTDEQLLVQMRKEFPHKAKVQDFSSTDGVRRVRSLYNRGILTDGKTPGTRSTAFDAQGNPFRRGAAGRSAGAGAKGKGAGARKTPGRAAGKTRVRVRAKGR